jgi:hypothetical protein
VEGEAALHSVIARMLSARDDHVTAATALRAAPDYADAMLNLALLLQRKNQYAEAADYWRRYLAGDGQSQWAARARRSLKFCEMQLHLVASAAATRTDNPDRAA